MQMPRTHVAIMQAVRTGEVTVHVAEAAHSLLANESFLMAWDTLYEACPWATVFQSRAFVSTWYQTYRSKYLPIIVKAEYGGQLTGLLTLSTLATNHMKGRIVGAGEYEAEYQTWLTNASDGESFIKAALFKVQEQFPGFTIYLRFIPPPAPLQWIDEPYWKRRCLLEPNSRPIMDMNDPGLTKKFSKTEFRNKKNRLQRLGPVTFERIHWKEQFAAILEELMVMYDFRQGAMFNLNQFKNEPLKGAFLLALFDQNLLHVSVLKVNDQIFSAIVAVGIHNWVHIAGINVHTPFQAKFYSPGFVHFIMLSQLLAQEGITVLDLTPGGDFYKERMATRHDEVYELIVSNDWAYRIKRKLRHRYFKSLEKAGKWPMGTVLAMRKRFYLLKSRLHQVRKVGLTTTVIKKIAQSINPPVNELYIATTDALVNTSTLSVNKDCLQDLLCFEANDTWPTRWEFLADAMQRFSLGESSYSYCENGKLLACVWLKTKEETPSSSTRDNKACLEGIYCHTEGQDQLPAFLTVVAQVAAQKQQASQVQVLVSSDQRFLCQTLEMTGFQLLNQRKQKRK